MEVWSGMEFAAFLTEHIMGPLQMDDTRFTVAESNRDRFTKNYLHGEIPLKEGMEGDYFAEERVPEPSGGLTGTLRDYWKFCQCLLNNLKGSACTSGSRSPLLADASVLTWAVLSSAGPFEGVRLLGRKTVEFMGANHLPENGDMATMGQATFSESPMDGIGFGLGVAVVINPAKSQLLRSAGEFYWGGMASTAFWIDPQEEVVAVFFTQLVPSGSTPIRPELRIAVNQAIIDEAPPAYAPSVGSVAHRL